MRHIKLVIIALVLGLVTAVAVPTTSFVCALTLQVGTTNHYFVGQRAWSVTLWKTPAFASISARLNADEDVAPITSDPRLPWWHTELRRPQFSPDHTSYVLTTFVFGWPFFALSDGLEIFSDDDYVVDVNTGPPTLIWSGALANVAILSVAWLFLIMAPSAARYFLRRRQGLCPRCKYSRRGSPSEICSECGADQKRLHDNAKKSQRLVIVASILVAMIAAVPTVQRWSWASFNQKLVEKSWLDAILDRHMSLLSDEYDELVHIIARDPDHASTIAAELPTLSDDEINSVTDLLSSLIDLEPRHEYLALIDELLVRTSEDRRLWPLMCYAGYSWDVVGERVLAMHEKFGVGDEKFTNAVLTVARQSWSHNESSEGKEDLETLLYSVLNDKDPRTALRSLHLLVLWDWISADEAEGELSDILSRDEALRDDWHYEAITELLGLARS